MNLQENIRRILREETKIPPPYILRRYTCMDDYITGLENGEKFIPISSGSFDWNNYQIILTAWLNNDCSGVRFYDHELHLQIMDVFGDRLYKLYKLNRFLI